MMKYKAQIIGVVWILMLCSVSMAQNQVIREIRIMDTDGRAYDVSSVEAYTTFSAGDSAPERGMLIDIIRQDVDRMRDSGRFSYVDAQLLLEETGLVVLYEVEQKHRLRQIEIRGSDKLGNKKVREKSELVIGGLVDDVDFELATAKIQDAYRDFWYPHVGISWTANVDRELGVVDLLIEVDEGIKIGIKEIQFVGNHTIDDKKLRGILSQKQKNWLSVFTDAGRYYPEFEEVDVYALKNLYMNNGFLDVQIKKAHLDSSEPQRSVMTYQIDEGRRYQISSVLVSGVKSVEAPEIEKRIPLLSGQVASFEGIEAGREVIRSYYGNRGYVNTRVEAIRETDALAGLVKINYVVQEGNKGTLAQVEITGNERTLDEVIRRELVLAPGEEYNRSRLRASENRLRNLNYFETVTITPDASDKPNEYDVLVKVKEKPTGQFNAGVGISSVDSLVGFVQLSQGNFNVKSWPPIGGRSKISGACAIGNAPE